MKVNWILLTLMFPVILASVSTAARCAELPWDLGHYHHTSFTGADGIVGANALAQTADGFLWINSKKGLVQYDGNQFRPFEPSSSEKLLHSSISTLFAPSTGGLWISYGGEGVSFIEHGRVTNYGTRSGWPEKAAYYGTYFFENRRHEVCAYVHSVGLMKFDKGVWRLLSTETLNLWPGNFAQDADRNLWVASSKSGAIYMLRDGAVHFTQVGNLAGAFGVSISDKGTIFISTADHLIHRFEFENGQLVVVGQSIPIFSRHVLTDSRGGLWIGSSDGIHYIRSLSALTTNSSTPYRSVEETFGKSQGLSGNLDLAVIEDREKNIWVASENGVDRFSPSAFSTLSLPTDMDLLTITPGSQGDAWIGSESTPVLHLNGRVLTTTNVPPYALAIYNDSNSGSVYSVAGEDLWQLAPGMPTKLATLSGHEDLGMTTDHQGRIWILQTESDSIEIWDGTRLTHTTDLGTPVSIAHDPSGTIWLGYASNRIVSVDGQSRHTFQEANGLSVGTIRAMAFRAGLTWVGGEEGLEFLKDGKFSTVKLDGAAKLSEITGLVFDRDGALWIHSPYGMIRIPSDDIQAVTQNPEYAASYKLFDQTDGVPGSPSMVHSLPSLREGLDGRIWIAGGTTAAWLDPHDIPMNPVKPLAIITALSGSNRNYDVDANATSLLPKEARSLQIDYTAPLLTQSNRVRFQYRLHGLDDTWQDAGNRRQAFYSHLKAGNYRFEVRATNENEPWATASVSAHFDIPPMWFETWWFRTLCVALAIALLWFALRWRINKATSQLRTRMQIRANERESIARDLHDTLLQSTQSLSLHLFALSQDVSDAHLQAELSRLSTMTNDAVKEGRDKVRHLRRDKAIASNPITSLSQIGEDLSARHDIRFRTLVKGYVRPLKMTPGEEVHLILKESIINAFLHSGATDIDLFLSFGRLLFIASVADNGRGLGKEMLPRGNREGHWGIPGMRERARNMHGSLTIGSRPSGGTKVRIVVGSWRLYSHRANSLNHPEES